MNTIAIGSRVAINNDNATAIGALAGADGLSGSAFGALARADAQNTTAVGRTSTANNIGATSVGFSSTAGGVRSTTVGAAATASATRATAVGAEATADELRATAVGYLANTTRANQVMLGGTGSSVAIGDIRASDAVQIGAEQFVTIDAAGTLGVSNAATTAQVDAVRVSMNHIAAVTDAQFGALEARVGTLAGSIDTLFDLTNEVDADAQRGIAAVASAANPHFPSRAGRTSYASNIAYYRGEVGVSAGLMHRFDGDFAITAGVSYAGGNSTAVRAGVAGEF